MTEDESGPTLVRTIAELRAELEGDRRAGRTVGFVPTMGYLHEGHLSLVDRARREADVVVVSIFVNPAQFGPDEDYDAYPRDLDRDLEAAADRGVDVVFAPEVAEMYPRPQTVWVEPGPFADRLCGASRPGHFRGVLTVVLKLFHAVEPDLAVFGRKDFQQLVLVRRMTEELNLPIRILGGPVVREPDGLAMSSRNAYLSDQERRRSLSLSRGLRRARRSFGEGERNPERLEEIAREPLEEADARIDYVEVVDPSTLERPEEARAESVCAVAAHVGDTRLIDNARLGGASSLEG
ncbi:MAG: pantoate--beta-alanine ligase [Gemmatimonadota bacterium]